MNYCNFCKQGIKPYQIMGKSIKGGTINFNNNANKNSNIGYGTFAGREVSYHLGCHKAFWSGKFLLVIFSIFLALLVGMGILMWGIITKIEYRPEVDLQSVLSKAISLIVTGSIILAISLITFIIAFVLQSKKIKYGDYANDYIDYEAKKIYDKQLKIK